MCEFFLNFGKKLSIFSNITLSIENAADDRHISETVPGK